MKTDRQLEHDIEAERETIQTAAWSAPGLPAVGLDSVLDRDRGLDSLARSELLSRIEQALGMRLPDETLVRAETVGDLLGAAPQARRVSTPLPARRPAAGGVEVGERIVGRLEVRGPSATAGCLRNPEQTARLFDDGWFDSGAPLQPRGAAGERLAAASALRDAAQQLIARRA